MGWQAFAAVCGVGLAMATQAAETVVLNHLGLEIDEPMAKGFSGEESEWRGADGKPNIRDGLLCLASVPGADATAWYGEEFRGHVLIWAERGGGGVRCE